MGGGARGGRVGSEALHECRAHLFQNTLHYRQMTPVYPCQSLHQQVKDMQCVCMCVCVCVCGCVGVSPLTWSSSCVPHNERGVISSFVQTNCKLYGL